MCPASFLQPRNSRSSSLPDKLHSRGRVPPSHRERPKFPKLHLQRLSNKHNERPRSRRHATLLNPSLHSSPPQHPPNRLPLAKNVNPLKQLQLRPTKSSRLLNNAKRSTLKYNNNQHPKLPLIKNDRNLSTRSLNHQNIHHLQFQILPQNATKKTRTHLEKYITLSSNRSSRAKKSHQQ